MAKELNSSAQTVVEQSLLDQRLLLVELKDFQVLQAVLRRTSQDNAGLKDLFSRPTPWQQTEAAKSTTNTINY